MNTDLERQRTQIEARIMDEAVNEKKWHIASHAGHGPVTIALRIPEVRVTDAEGREIVIAPKQAGLVAMKLGNIDDWLQNGDAEWTGED